MAGLVLGVVVVGLVVLGLVHRDGPDTAAPKAARPWSPPAPVAPGELLVRTRVTTGSDAVVDEWLQAAAPLSSMRLVPRAEQDGGPLRIERVVVEADGDRVTAGGGASGERRYRLAAARRIHVSYTISGALSNSSRGRAVLRTTGLRLVLDSPPTSSVVTVSGAQVLSMACQGPGAAQPQPCGDLESGSWSARLSGEAVDSDVLAAVQLAR